MDEKIEVLRAGKLSAIHVCDDCWQIVQDDYRDIAERGTQISDGAVCLRCEGDIQGGATFWIIPAA